jgi:hypothetical protein
LPGSTERRRTAYSLSKAQAPVVSLVHLPAAIRISLFVMAAVNRVITA